MTDAEALALKPGDRVEVLSREPDPLGAGLKTVWHPAKVLRVEGPFAGWYFTAAPRLTLARFRPGRPADRVYRVPANVRAVRDATLPHVIADWLEERGELSAAALLRKHFPLREEG